MNTIFANKTLNMPTGKLAAQVSHGAMKLLLDRFYLSDNKLIMSDDKSIEWYHEWKEQAFKVNVELVPFSIFDSESVKIIGTTAYIIDSGRTIFNGIPTLTVIAQTNIVLMDYKRQIEPQLTEKTNEESRQILLVDRSSSAIDDPTSIASQTASLSLLNLIQYLESDGERYYFDLTKNEELKSWLLGSFAKITLSLKSESKINNSLAKIKEIGIKFVNDNSNGISLSAIGPCKKSTIESITKKMQLL
jgi:peptidyl-tRNA hydrolase